MISISDLEVSKALNILESISDELRYERICQLDDLQKATYARLLDDFKKMHSVKAQSENASKNLHNMKGEALEKLVSYLLTISGGIFYVDRNLRTSTNEIDQVVSLTPKGKILLGYHLINPKLRSFLGECKNYDKPVSVTYIGKFCSLLLTNNVKVGILFSYHGVSGSGWSYGAGLIKKFYLHKEKLEDKYCIIDFSIKDFESILNGKNMIQIIEEQLQSLQFDTDYSQYLSKHPAE
ncbi:restriction endonuclease [Faecalicatena sp. AGMB00832]|uniref:Restriction endonuclease n=1 Tax=Faecalicatena faecalis TaxID=2726362 RepID=A0ABS6CYJ5_9FIRM|nr:restriction endonuclease [Faecalicatena faecalis]MBU3874321.1 restriction endonuclease [Faecalicatena faecalis]